MRERVPIVAADLGEFDEGRKILAFEKVRFGGSCGSLRLAGSGFVERTDFLAYVAAEDPAVCVYRQIPFLLDGLIADALVRVDLPAVIFVDDCASWAGVDAFVAGTAPAFAGLVGLKFDTRKKHADEEPTSPLRVDEHGVLAKPAETSEVGVGPFEDRGAIDAGPELGPRVILRELRG